MLPSRCSGLLTQPWSVVYERPGLPPSGFDPDRPLIDLDGFAAGVRWRRRVWTTLAVVGLLLGVAAATVLPSRASASADIFVIHENEGESNGPAQMKTDLALLETTTVATDALEKLNSTVTPEKFVTMYSGTIVADNILEVTASGANDAEAIARAEAVADAFITVHVKQTTDGAQAVVKAYLDRRAEVQRQLDSLNAQITAAGNGPNTESVLNQRSSLASQISNLDSAGRSRPPSAHPRSPRGPRSSTPRIARPGDCSRACSSMGDRFRRRVAPRPHDRCDHDDRPQPTRCCVAISCPISAPASSRRFRHLCVARAG